MWRGLGTAGLSCSEDALGPEVYMLEGAEEAGSAEHMVGPWRHSTPSMENRHQTLQTPAEEPKGLQVLPPH